MPSKKITVAYYPGWGIYGRKYNPPLIPVKDLTHLLYCFGRPEVKAPHKPGEVTLPDVNDPKTLGEVLKLRSANPDMKILYSIGGWNYSQGFPEGEPRRFDTTVKDPTRRKNFVDSSIKILDHYKLDGLDVDYEYPPYPEEAAGFASLLEELRAALDLHAHEKGLTNKLLLTVAAPCGDNRYKVLPIARMDKSVDFWGLMAYDFFVGVGRVANHQANLYSYGASPDYSGSTAVDYYHGQGVDYSKMIFGIPLYGRSFAGTDGFRQSCVGPGGESWEPGAVDYRSLPLPGLTVQVDTKAVAAYTYDANKKEFISFDNEVTAKIKGEYIKSKGLAGAMFWELSGDKADPPRVVEDQQGNPYRQQVGKQSLIPIVNAAMN